MLQIPPALRHGDTVSAVAPSGPIDVEAFARAVAEFERRGLRVKTYRDVTVRAGYLAGSDAQRADELNQALADPDTRAILPIRGGYGAARIIDRIEYQLLADRPKLLCGFSDITALHAAVHRYAGITTFHGPNLQDGIGSSGGLNPAIASSYWQALTGEQPAPANHSLPTSEALVPGKADGPLVGGNLAVLCGLIGTPYEPDTNGAILLLEDINEQLYRIDRMLAQLRLAGKLKRLAGIALGHFTACSGDADGSEGLLDLFSQYFANLGVPVLANVAIGHNGLNQTVPLGFPLHLDTDAGGLDVESAYARIRSARNST